MPTHFNLANLNRTSIAALTAINDILQNRQNPEYSRLAKVLLYNHGLTPPIGALTFRELIELIALSDYLDRVSLDGAKLKNTDAMFGRLLGQEIKDPNRPELMSAINTLKTKFEWGTRLKNGQLLPEPKPILLCSPSELTVTRQELIAEFTAGNVDANNLDVHYEALAPDVVYGESSFYNIDKKVPSATGATWEVSRTNPTQPDAMTVKTVENNPRTIAKDTSRTGFSHLAQMTQNNPVQAVHVIDQAHTASTTANPVVPTGGGQPQPTGGGKSLIYCKLTESEQIIMNEDDPAERFKMAREIFEAHGPMH